MGVDLVARGERCPSCGETVFDYAEVGRQEKLMVAGIVARGIRTGGEFKLVRKSAGLKATELAAMLDVRPETVSRWESGTLELPRLAAFALGELYERPRAIKARLEAFTRAS